MKHPSSFQKAGTEKRSSTGGPGLSTAVIGRNMDMTSPTWRRKWKCIRGKGPGSMNPRLPPKGQSLSTRVLRLLMMMGRSLQASRLGQLVERAGLTIIVRSMGNLLIGSLIRNRQNDMYYTSMTIPSSAILIKEFHQRHMIREK